MPDQRGTCDFAVKVSNCQASGGVGAVLWNNVAGGFGGFGVTLGTMVTSIPSVTASQAEGQAMLGQIGQTATVAVTPASCACFDGTSMATPHMKAVAALVWAHNLNCTAAQLRASPGKSAQDLGPRGARHPVRFRPGAGPGGRHAHRIKTLGCGN